MEYNVTAYNGVSMGQFLMKEDGYYDFWPEDRAGYWPAHMLRALADELDKINKDWDKAMLLFFNSLERNKKEDG